MKTELLRATDIYSYLHWAADYLKEMGIINPVPEARQILASVLKCKISDLYLHRWELSRDEEEIFISLIRKRGSAFPLQYLLGSVEFMGITLRVEPGVFIPRPETELLVEKALELLTHSPSPFTYYPSYKHYRILDLGTGSGNIAISLAKFHPALEIVATDISEFCLGVALMNASINDCTEKIVFRKSNLFECMNRHEKFDMIVSNPPYIPSESISGLAKEVLFEPKVAYEGGEKGLFYIQEIIKNSPFYLKNNGFLLLEIGIDQAKEIKKIIASISQLRILKIIKDYQGFERIVILQYFTGAKSNDRRKK